MRLGIVATQYLIESKKVLAKSRYGQLPESSANDRLTQGIHFIRANSTPFRQYAHFQISCLNEKTRCVGNDIGCNGGDNNIG